MVLMLVNVFKFDNDAMLVSTAVVNVAHAFPAGVPSGRNRSSNENKPPKLVLLDRDGVINEDVGPPGVVSKNELVLTRRAGTAIGKLKRSGCRVVIVTNQSCVGKGLLTKTGLTDIHNQMGKLLMEEDADAVVDQIYVCTSTKEMNDPRMKPSPGMLLEAIRDANVSPSDCVLIGDTISDLQAASTAGIPWRILVSTGCGQSIMRRLPLIWKDGTTTTKTTCSQLQSQVAPTAAETVQQPIKNPFLSIPPSILPFDYTLNLEAAVSLVLGGDSYCDSVK
jgi:D-glycero-D-manno-heptose 1,7-bisphosphate phosphatase